MSELDEKIDTLPLNDWHRAQGGRMVPFAGYEMPLQYEGIVTEHDWTRSSASLFDVSHMGQLSLTGEGAAEALEALLPGAITSLKSGGMRYSLLLNEKGGVIDDLIVTNTGLHTAIVVNGATKHGDIAHMRAHLPDSVTLTLHDQQALLALQGPQAANALSALVPGVEELTFMRAGLFDWNGTPLWISRAGYTGEDGFEISVPAGKAAELADALIADARVKPAGLGARDSLRLEAGLPLYGHDLDETIDPVTADLGFALTKKRREAGGWMGHAAVMQVIEQGPAQKRVGLMIDGRLPAREGAVVFSGDQEVGRVTSGGFSPTLGYPIAMAYVDSSLSEEGTALDIEVRGKRLAAQVVPMPFVPHRYHR